jgi:ATP-dependent protease ClpP protease subunit
VDRDFWMSATEAKEYGLIDTVLEPKKKPGQKAA